MKCERYALTDTPHGFKEAFCAVVCKLNKLSTLWNCLQQEVWHFKNDIMFHVFTKELLHFIIGEKYAISVF